MTFEIHLNNPCKGVTKTYLLSFNPIQLWKAGVCYFRLIALICLKLLFRVADPCVSGDAFDSAASKPAETTLEHLMSCFLLWQKRGDLGCISATQRCLKVM